MIKESINTFIKGMNKDIDKSVISKDSYLDAFNFRITTSKGSSSGALENIKGNKHIAEHILTSAGAIVATKEYLVISEPVQYDSVDYHVGDIFTGIAMIGTYTGTGKVLDLEHADMLPKNQLVCGACRLRDYIILFTTSNTSTPVHGVGRNMIYKLVVNKTTESVSSLTLLYDDNLNTGAGTDTLDFSIANKIKALSKYETPNIQKVYWTDGYNHLRYANVSNPLTTDGQAYSAPGDYMATAMFDFLPLFNPTKPVLNDIVSGQLFSGVVQYSYQLYKINGATTSFSPVSDPIHIVSTGDFKSNTNYYFGDEASVNTGKGCKLKIDVDTVGYDRLRLIRIHYSTLNQVPVISVATELEIDTAGGTIYTTDTGDIVDTLTLDEFNILSTELFTCEDIAIKDNRLFAANIEKSEFVIDDFDSRVIRYRTWNDPADVIHHAGAVTPQDQLVHGVEATFSYIDDNTVEIEIASLSSYIPIVAPNVITAVNSVTSSVAAGNIIAGTYEDVGGPGVAYSAAWDNYTISNVTYLGDTLTFRIDRTAGNMFANFVLLETGSVEQIIINYDWDEYPSSTDAMVTDLVSGDLTISVPLSDDQVGWANAGWDTTDLANTFPVNHDAINVFNNPVNDGSAEYGYKYQYDGVTLGAEGPNIKIDFVTSDFYLDTSNNHSTFYAVCPTDVNDLSYQNYASPWKAGKLSWQRDEVYRLFAVFGNGRNQLSLPQWICDLRMPSFHDGTSVNSSAASIEPWKIASKEGGTGYVESCSLHPRIYFKDMPANATFAKIYRVRRERQDRFVVTQGFAIPSYLDGTVYRPAQADTVLLATDDINLIKLVSPEVNVTQNISLRSNDYVEYITSYNTNTTNYEDTNEAAGDGEIIKLLTNTRVPYVANTKSTINDAIMISPESSVTSDGITINSLQYCNFNEEATPTAAKGCTGYLINYVNNSFSAEGVRHVIVNYKSNVYGSQYGGHTYEDRLTNISIPCSDIITTTATWHNIEYGDTFINYFDVRSLLADLSAANQAATWAETLYIPLESSVNCDLLHSKEMRHVYPNPYTPTLLLQEYAGTHSLTYEIIQTTPLYQYNTVYSQQTTSQFAVSSMLDLSTETQFDCLIKASNVKYTGELSDSWTKFSINEEIEVDSNHGEVRALNVIQDKLLFWQENAFGVLSVNPRSLIQDDSSAQLVLGTGGVLDRYDYISITIGILDKFAIVNSGSAIYWFYDKNYSIYKFDNQITNLCKDKGLWSWFKNNYSSLYKVHGIYDKEYNDVIFTLYKLSDKTGHTISFNEQTDQFVSFYNFIPYMYIDNGDHYLGVNFITGVHVTNSYTTLFYHNSAISPRSRFNSLLSASDADLLHTYPSTIKLMYNEGYPATKVFDNIQYVSNAYNETTDVEQYNITFDKIRCYNDYQNTDWFTLTYDSTVTRKERGWSLAVPRNLVNVGYASSPDIFSALATTKDWGERIRDKYMILDLYFNNISKTRFVVPFMGTRYRISYR